MVIATLVIWSIWHNRNDVVWNHRGKPTEVIVYAAIDLLDQWILANKAPTGPNSKVAQEEGTSWEKPPEGVIKCNVDAALFTNPSPAGFSCILRDSQGLFISAIYGNTPGTHSPAMAEALGIREALSWLKRRQAQNVIVESDAQIIINALNAPNVDLTSLGLIIEDCQSLAAEIPNCSFKFAFRSANRVAYTLARATASMSGQVGCIYPSPTSILDVLASDLG